MSSNRSVTYSLFLNSNVRQILTQTEQSAMSLDKTMSSLRSGIATLGLGLAAREVVNTGKEWVQGAADYETAMMRIKNATNNPFEGIKNQMFITDQVTKLKLDLQEATDSYGQFLLKIKNSSLNEEQKNRMFENLSIVGKVGAIPASQIAPAIRDVAIMLGEGILEARHLRALTYVHPQLTPFIADQLGLKDNNEETKSQQLNKALSSGKLTRSAIDSKVLVDAIEEYRKSVEGSLPDSLKTITSETIELSNAWLTFKNDVVLELKPELIELFGSLKDGIHWMKEHQDLLISIGGLLLKIGGQYLAVKTGILLWNLAIGSYNSLSGLAIKNTIEKTAAINSEAIAVAELTAAIERLNYVSNATNANFIATAEGSLLANTKGNRFIASAEGAAMAEGAAVGAGASKIGGVGSYVMPVMLALIGADALTALVNAIDPQSEQDKKNAKELSENQTMGLLKDKESFSKISSIFSKGDNSISPSEIPASPYSALAQILNPSLRLGIGNTTPEEIKAKNNKDFGKSLLPKTSSIRGNSVTNIHVEVKEMNGLNKPTFTVRNMKDMDNIEKIVGDVMVKQMTQAINDSQLIGNHH